MRQTIILPEKVTRIVKSTITEDIDPKQWVHVAGTKYFVNKHPEVNGYIWENALRQTLTTTPFRATPPSIFTPHYTQVCSSVRKRNPTILYDGTGEPFSRSARDEIYEQRTANTWIHLDARFEQREDNKLWMLTDHVLVNDELQPTTQQPLERRVLRENGFVELQWNKQGMPVKKSKVKDYVLGKNIRYVAPVDGGIVWFIAGSDWFILSCGGDLYSDAAFGVLFCAEGAAKKK